MSAKRPKVVSCLRAWFHLSLTDLFHFHSLISLGLDTKIYLDRFRKRMLKNNTFLLHLNVMPRVHPYAMSLEWKTYPTNA